MFFVQKQTLSHAMFSFNICAKIKMSNSDGKPKLEKRREGIICFFACMLTFSQMEKLLLKQLFVQSKLFTS